MNKYPAYTVEGRKGFFPSFNDSVRSNLHLKGLHNEVETRMIDQPGKRIPTKYLAKKYKCSEKTVSKIAARIENTHKLPKRLRGGTNTALPQEFSAAISRLVSGSMFGSGIKLWPLIIKFSKYGFVPSVISIRKKFYSDPNWKKKKLSLDFAGLTEADILNLDSLIDHVSRVRRRPFQRLRAFRARDLSFARKKILR